MSAGFATCRSKPAATARLTSSASAQPVIATMYVSDTGRTSFESWCTLSRSDDPDTVYASGGATTVWVNFPAQKSAPIPDSLRQHLQG